MFFDFKSEFTESWLSADEYKSLSENFRGISNKKFIEILNKIEDMINVEKVKEKNFDGINTLVIKTAGLLDTEDLEQCEDNFPGFSFHLDRPKHLLFVEKD